MIYHLLKLEIPGLELPCERKHYIFKNDFCWILLSNFYSPWLFWAYVYVLGMLSSTSMPPSHCPTAPDHTLSTLSTVPFQPANANHHRKWFNIYKHWNWNVPWWIEPLTWTGKINQLMFYKTEITLLNPSYFTVLVFIFNFHEYIEELYHWYLCFVMAFLKLKFSLPLRRHSNSDLLTH